MSVHVHERSGQQSARRDWAAGATIVQRFTFQVLHGEEGNAVLLTNMEQRTDLRMMERRDGARFGFESAAAVRPIDEVAQQHLDGNRAIETGVSRCIDLTHTADANQRKDFVRAESRAC